MGKLLAKIWWKDWLLHLGRSLKDWLPLKWPKKVLIMALNPIQTKIDRLKTTDSKNLCILSLFFSISRYITMFVSLWTFLRNYKIIWHFLGLYLRITSTKIKTIVNTSMYEVYQKKSVHMLPKVTVAGTILDMWSSVFWLQNNISTAFSLLFKNSRHVPWRREWLL